MPKSKSDQPIALDRAHLGSLLHRSRGQSSVLESWRSLGSPQLPGPSFPAYESPPTANRRAHWWGFSTLQEGSRRILPPSGWGSELNKRTMMVLYRSPEYLAVKVYNEDKYQSSRPNEYEIDKTNNFNRGLCL